MKLKLKNLKQQEFDIESNKFFLRILKYPGVIIFLWE